MIPKTMRIKAQIFSVSNGAANGPVKLNLAANLTDTDGSETLAVSVSTIPVGATLTDGTCTASRRRLATPASISAGWSFGNLTVTPAQGFSGDLKLTVNATATDHAMLSTGAPPPTARHLADHRHRHRTSAGGGGTHQLAHDRWHGQ